MAGCGLVVEDLVVAECTPLPRGFRVSPSHAFEPFLPEHFHNHVIDESRVFRSSTCLKVHMILNNA
jgi:cephalosporin hydroxylase